MTKFIPQNSHFLFSLNPYKLGNVKIEIFQQLRRQFNRNLLSSIFNCRVFRHILSDS